MFCLLENNKYLCKRIWKCACGVTGSRARLRIWWSNPCRFESYQAHITNRYLVEYQLDSGSFFILSLHRHKKKGSVQSYLNAPQ